MSANATARSLGHGEHVALFYRHHTEVTSEVARMTRRFLEDGATAILVLAEANAGDYKTALAAEGIDIGTRLAARDLILIDARAVTDLIVSGEIEHEGFERVVTSLFDELEPDRPVFVYGEAVSVLWDAGDVPAAFALEQEWSKLFARGPLTMVCGYRSEMTTGSRSESLDGICALHSKVLSEGTPADGGSEPAARFASEQSADFEPEPASARAARRFVTGTLERWSCAQTVIEDAQLVVGELAGNAILHARTRFRVEVHHEGGAVKLAVRDMSALAPVARVPGSDDTSGRGLRLVATLAATWGTTAHDGGKTVWAVLDL